MEIKKSDSIDNDTIGLGVLENVYLNTKHKILACLEAEIHTKSFSRHFGGHLGIKKSDSIENDTIRSGVLENVYLDTKH